MSEATAPTAVAELSFEQALAELETIVDRLDRGEIPLEQSIEAYERGTALRRHCEQKLAEARLRVERLVEGEDGAVATEPLDPEAS
ncbi:MAG: exodeoxyribonuclease VII small subunit [Deinococcus-Thermus bacterium]|jgi:exodeoxyribonuclease VII small subunit|nr:exodeoxyribonuclease VII small subunit [Deinococcota bacterium]